jgi:HD superfamily phosphohydrolase
LKKQQSHQSKIFNDPVYGFIQISDEMILSLIDHPYVQRLRRIKQMGLASLVYPGANHTRFHHALGATQLMQDAIMVLREKGVDITDEEKTAAMAAILLHDIGHGPFSHALEHTLISGISHEQISLGIMKKINEELGGKLDMAIRIFQGSYEKKFLCSLVSGQLDTDRLDYLRRDSFYTGVSEGVIGSERIIKLIDVEEDDLVVEEKGIYSLEKFLIARRLMYWQVYLHKTVIVSELMIVNVLKRAREIALAGGSVFSGSAFRYFLESEGKGDDLFVSTGALEHFCMLDDSDITSAIKEWSTHPDPVLSDLSKRIMNRNLLKISLTEYEQPDFYEQIIKSGLKQFGISDEFIPYYIHKGSVKNTLYSSGNRPVRIRMKNGEIRDITDASATIKALSEIDNSIKFFISYIR